MNECFNKDLDIFPEGDPLIILDRKSDAFMVNNGKDTNHTRKISIRVHSVRNGEK